MSAISAPERLRLSLDMEQVAAWYAAGESTRDIGRRLGVAEKTVWRHMKAHGIPLRTSAHATPHHGRPPGAVRRNAALRDEALALARGGMDDMKIARRLGMAQTSVRRIRHEAQVPAVPRRPTVQATRIDMETALRMWEAGARLREIAAVLGVSAGVVGARLAEKGLETGRRSLLERIPGLGDEAARMITAGGVAADVAAALGVSAGHVRRFAARRGMKIARHVAPCGTAAAYSAGCRCGDCQDAHLKAVSAWREERSALVAAGDEAIPHGTATGYSNWGCRCPDCKAAGSRANAYSAAARRVRAGVAVSALTARQQAAWRDRHGDAA